ncbi:helix-turn-helix domain-containing protein [Brucella pseudogrignonensis]|nr:AraC family transcriptional regulator [Brucella pseudogrignonensis]
MPKRNLDGSTLQSFSELTVFFIFLEWDRMPCNNENSRKNKESVQAGSRKNEEKNWVEPDNLGKSFFSYGVQQPGVRRYVSKYALIIILLESVRNLKWKVADNHELTANCIAGTIFFVPAETELTFSWPDSVEYLLVTIPETNHSISDLAKASAESVKTRGEIVSFSSKPCLQISQLVVGCLRDAHDSDESYLSALHSVVIHILLRSEDFVGRPGPSLVGLSAYATRQIESYLAENFNRPLSVPDMAVTLGISAGHFATCFRESFGQTPHQYLMNLRLNKAERLLKETEIPINAIAAQLSFSSQSHLTTALRKYRQLTPGEIRRRGSRQRNNPLGKA